MSSEGGEKRLGLRLQQARKAAGFTQQQLCQKSGLSYSTLAKIERGAIKSPSIFTIQQIASSLNSTVDQLLGEETSLPRLKKKSKRGLTFVYFDINGCLVRFFHRAFAAAARDTGVSADIVESTFWHYNDIVCRGEMNMTEFNRNLARKFEIESFDWEPYYLQAVEPINETAELIRWAEQHYRVGLLSNIMPGLIQKMVQNGSLPQINYDVIVDSSEVRAIKPEPRIYQVAREKANVPSEEILLIDDSRTNLMAAEKAGWHVLWFDDYRPKESVQKIQKTLEF